MLKKFNDLSLVARIFLAIVVGIILGQLSFLPEWFLRVFVTFSSLLSSFLNFIVPLMIVAFVVDGISNIETGAGKTLTLTAGLAYLSYLLVGLGAYFTGYNLFPKFINATGKVSIEEGFSLESLIDFPIEPFFSVTGGLVFAVVVGLALNYLKKEDKGLTLVNLFHELAQVIKLVLGKFFIPLVPLMVLGNFVNLSYSGQIGEVLRVFGFVFAVFILEHWLTLLVYLTGGALIAGRSVKDTFKNALEPYMYAFGTQSSAMSIPTNIAGAVANGNDEPLVNAILPITASMHMPGSMISTVNLTLAALVLYGMDYSPALFVPFILVLALGLTATPGVPGGAIVAAIPYMEMVGISAQGPIASLLITLYLAQDSFGTSTNVTSDQGLILVLDKIYKSWINNDK